MNLGMFTSQLPLLVSRHFCGSEFFEWSWGATGSTAYRGDHPWPSTPCRNLNNPRWCNLLPSLGGREPSPGRRDASLEERMGVRGREGGRGEVKRLQYTNSLSSGFLVYFCAHAHSQNGEQLKIQKDLVWKITCWLVDLCVSGLTMTTFGYRLVENACWGNEWYFTNRLCHTLLPIQIRMWIWLNHSLQQSTSCCSAEAFLYHTNLYHEKVRELRAD